MPRYVVLQHITAKHSECESHYDLMLEKEGKLLTWAIPELPRAGLDTRATKLPDHRLAYLDYQGPISGDRGEVRRVEVGEYVARELSETQALFELQNARNRLVAELRHQSDDTWIAQFYAAK
jgi:hypothetical protein